MNNLIKSGLSIAGTGLISYGMASVGKNIFKISPKTAAIATVAIQIFDSFIKNRETHLIESDWTNEPLGLSIRLKVVRLILKFTDLLPLAVAASCKSITPSEIVPLFMINDLSSRLGNSILTQVDRAYATYINNKIKKELAARPPFSQDSSNNIK